MSDLHERLNLILPRITSQEFLGGSGIGNEIGFYIFDYPAEEELRVRDYLKTLLEHMPRHSPSLRVRHLNLFDFLLDYLRSRNLLEKALIMQKKKGNPELLKMMLGTLNVQKNLMPFFVQTVEPLSQDMVLISGVGSAYPLVKTSTFLTNLDKFMGRTPLVVFYPGKYDQLTLRLFGKLRQSLSLEESNPGNRKTENYYRAFRLV